MAVTRRRSSRDEEQEEARDERRSRSRRDRHDDEEEREERRPRRRSRDDEDERPSRRRSRDEERPSRRRSRDEDEDERPSRRRSQRGGSSGFGAYASRKRNTGSFADEFKPSDNTPILIRFMEDGPFDTYNQHWVEEGDAAGKTRHSFVCRDGQVDDYFDDDDECPLCELGFPASTQSLFNVLDLSNPRKPEIKVWRTSPVVTDRLLRASEAEKTSPLNRDDLYFEVERVKKGRKSQWEINPVKARDLPEDYDMDPLEDDEIEEFERDLFQDRKAVTKVDTYDELADLADSIES